MSWALRLDLLLKTTLSISIKLKGTFHNAAQPPFINIEALENLIQLRNLLVSEDKYVLVRSFPGPVGSPILSVGGLSTPQLPPDYHYDNPTDNLAVQQAIKDQSTSTSRSRNVPRNCLASNLMP